MSASLIIAVDGPAASGKGTLAKAIARKYDLAHLDTGSLYRAVGHLVLARSGNPADEAAALEAVRRLTPDLLSDPSLRTTAAGGAASIVAAIPAVRAALLSYQREFAGNPPGGKRGAVLDGRDIGTTICPDAPIKIFVTARPEIRARRRWLEIQDNDASVEEGEVLADILARDARDSSRTSAPLRMAEDAHLLDTSELSIEAAFAAACAVIDERLKNRTA